jgi:hypothetical protein
MAKCPGNGDSPRFRRVFVLPVAPFLGNQVPPVCLYVLDYITDLHHEPATILSNGHWVLQLTCKLRSCQPPTIRSSPQYRRVGCAHQYVPLFPGETFRKHDRAVTTPILLVCARAIHLLKLLQCQSPGFSATPCLTGLKWMYST